MNAIFYVCICLFVYRHSVPVECPQLWCHKTGHWNEVSISLLLAVWIVCSVHVRSRSTSGKIKLLCTFYFVINQKLINGWSYREELRVFRGWMLFTGDDSRPKNPPLIKGLVMLWYWNCNHTREPILYLSHREPLTLCLWAKRTHLLALATTKGNLLLYNYRTRRYTDLCVDASGKVRLPHYPWEGAGVQKSQVISLALNQFVINQLGQKAHSCLKKPLYSCLLLYH